MPSKPLLPADLDVQLDEALRSAFAANNTARVRRNIVDAIAPLIVEWAQRDALLSAADDMPGGGRTSQYWDGERVEYATYEVYPHKRGPADWLRDRARFTPETTGGTTNDL